MSDLLITNDSYLLRMEMIEMDEYLPSFKMKVELILYHPTGIFKYSANDIWFECNNWDNFITQIRGNEQKKFNITLSDMSDWFIVILESNIDSNKLSFSLKEQFGGIIANLNLSIALDLDSLSIFKHAFMGFTKWW